MLGINSSGGVTSAATNSQISSFLSNLPGYQFTLQQGLQATQSNQAAQGLAQSGSAAKAATQYAEGLAQTNYENYVQQYLSTANLGAGAAESLAGQGLGAQLAASQFATSGAAASAAGTVGSANAAAGGINAAAGGINSTALLLGLSNGGLFGNPNSAGSFTLSGGQNSPPSAEALLGLGQ